MLALNRPHSPTGPTSPWNCDNAAAANWAREVGQAGVKERLRASVSSKLLRNGRGTRRPRFRFVAECVRESYQASWWCSQRQPVPAFEPGK